MVADCFNFQVGRTETDTFSESWEGAIITFVAVLAATVFAVFYLRRAKDQERVRESENEKRISGNFRNLNSDQELLSLSEAQLQAKEGKLDRQDTLPSVGRAVSQNDFDHMLAAVVRQASPEPDSSAHSSVGPPVAPPKPQNRPAVFTRTPVQTQDASDISARAVVNSGAESSSNTAPKANGAASSSAAPSNAVSNPSTVSNANTTSTSTTANSTASNVSNPPVNAKVTAPRPAAAKAASNVQKMTAFWSNTGK